MSDKDRQKKDHMSTDKKNKAMRERENERTERPITSAGERPIQFSHR